MIHLITGAINQGKSTRLLGIYRRLGSGDGFYNRRILRGNETIGQTIIHLATGESRILAYQNGFIPDGWNEECTYGPFSFSREGLEFGRRIIESSLGNQVSPLFIDEIGPLELAGKGWDAIFAKTLRSKTESYVVVRSQCIPAVIRKYAIGQFEIVDWDEGTGSSSHTQP